MKIASNILLTATAAAVLAAVWAPGAWWQWTITALVLLLAGAGTGAAADKPQPHHQDGHIPDTTLTNTTGRPERITHRDVDDYKRREFGRKAEDQ